MPELTAAAAAHPNIALIKYWGNRDDALRLPANGSLSMNLGGLETRTRVTFDPALEADHLILNDAVAASGELARVSAFLDTVRQLAGIPHRAGVESWNNFPTGAGIASSAAAFAALSLAASAAAGLDLSEKDLSRLARRGSGSACRSVPGGYVEWLPGSSDLDSYAVSIAPPEHWALADCITVVSAGPKPLGSSQGHRLASSSPFQKARVAGAPRRLAQARRAILSRDFDALAQVIELDSNLMHAVMLTGQPALLYFLPGSIAVMQAVLAWRGEGLPVAYTLDAGPNVHVLCPAAEAESVRQRLARLSGVLRVLVALPGGQARWIHPPA